VKVEVLALGAEVEESADFGQRFAMEYEEMDLYATVQLRADDWRGPEEITHALEDTEDSLLTLCLHIA
jgi:hypothetical protein